MRFIYKQNGIKKNIHKCPVATRNHTFLMFLYSKTLIYIFIKWFFENVTEAIPLSAGITQSKLSWYDI